MMKVSVRPSLPICEAPGSISFIHGDAQEPSSEVLQEILGDGAEAKWREVDKATSDGTWGA